jgi:hypothetical protein
MYRRAPLRKPVSLQFDVSTEGPPYPLAHAGSLRTARSFGVSYPNEDFPSTSKRDSMPSPEGGLAAQDEVALRLARLEPETEDQKARRGVLLGRLAELLEEIATLTAEATNDRTTRLTAEHKEIRRLGRIAEKELQKASDAFVGADIFFMNCAAAQDEARSKLEALHDLEQRGQHVRRFHSDKELSDWRETYEAAQLIVRTANETAQEAANARNAAQQALQTAREEVGRLANEESRIRSALRGLPHWDSALGLGEPGASRMTPEIASMMARRE